MPFLASNINKEKYSCFWVTEILNKTRKLISDYKVTFWSILLSSFDFHEKKFLWSDLLHNYQIFCKISLKFVREIWSYYIYIKLSIFWMFTTLSMSFEHVHISTRYDRDLVKWNIREVRQASKSTMGTIRRRLEMTRWLLPRNIGL